jgi:hypothetical protein
MQESGRHSETGSVHACSPAPSWSRRLRRLVGVEAVAADKTSRKLDFAPKGKAKTFTIGDLKLREARNEIPWAATSMDDHSKRGTIVFIVEQGAEPGSPAPSGARHAR